MKKKNNKNKNLISQKEEIRTYNLEPSFTRKIYEEKKEILLLY